MKRTLFQSIKKASWTASLLFAALLTLSLALPSMPAAQASPLGLSDGTIPILLAAAPDADPAAGESAVSAINIAEHLSLNGELDTAVLDAKTDAEGDALIHCLADDIKSPGTFTLSQVTVAIKSICRSESGEWTFVGKDRVSGDSYLLKGSTSIAEDGTIAFTGTAYRQLATPGKAKAQSLGEFSLIGN